MQLVLSYQCTVGAPLWSAKDFIYIWMALVLLIYLYMHIIYPPMESEATAGSIYTFQRNANPIRVCIIP